MSVRIHMTYLFQIKGRLFFFTARPSAISEVVGGRVLQEVAIKNLEYPRAQDHGQAQWGPRKKFEKVLK